MKNSISASIILVVIAIAYLTYSARSVDEVEVDGYYLKTYNLFERYQYHRNIRLVVFEQDEEALQQLIDTDCSGAGCYSHGKTLIQILIKMGDDEFSQLLIHLNSKALISLHSLLQAGHEYGHFPNLGNEKSFKRNFPQTLTQLEVSVRHQTSDVRPNNKKD